MKRLYRKNAKKIKRQHKRHLSFLEALRLYSGMPVALLLVVFLLIANVYAEEDKLESTDYDYGIETVDIQYA